MTEKRPWHWLAIIVIMILAFLFRTSAISDMVIQSDDSVRLLGVDPHFYKRHAHYSSEHFPSIQKYDIATHYPTGVIADAAGLYPISIAAISNIVGFGKPTKKTVDLVCAYLPPILGAISFLLVFLIASQLGGPIAAVTSAILYLLFPGQSLARSAFGFTDHHILEIIFLLWIIYSLIRLWSKGERKPWRPYTLGIPFGLAFTIWPGAPLYLLIIGCIVLGRYTILGYHQIIDRKEQWLLAKYLCGTMVTLIAVVIIWPELLTVSQRDVFTKVFVGLSILAFFPPLYLQFSNYKAYQNKPKKWSLLTLIVIIAGIAVFLSQTSLGREVYFWLNYKFVGLIENRKVSLPFMQYLFGYHVFVGLVSAAFLLVLPFGTLKDLHKIMIAIPTLFLTFFWINTYDLDYMPAPFLAICIGITATWIYETVEKRRQQQLLRPAAKVLKKGQTKSKAKQSRPMPSWLPSAIAGLPILVGLSSFVIVPTISSPVLQKDYMTSALFYSDGWYEAAEWMRDHTPAYDSAVAGRILVEQETREQQDFKYPEGTYGIMTAWDYGNLMNTVAERFPVWSRWPSTTATDWMFTQNERSSLDNICPKCDPNEQVKYAIVDARMVGDWVRNKMQLAGIDPQDVTHQIRKTVQDQAISVVDFNQKYESAIMNKLHRYSGNGLSHYRMVYDSPQQHGISTFSQSRNVYKRNFAIENEADFDRLSNNVRRGAIATEDGILHNSYIDSEIKVFEIVKGAVVQGKTDSGAYITAAIQLESTSSGKNRNYTQSTRTNKEGLYQLILPYATEKIAKSALQPTGSYQIDIESSSIDMTIELYVSNEQVEQGDTILINSRINEE